MKKLSKNYIGICELKQLPEGTYFRTLNKDNKMSKETYTMGYYERREKKYICEKHSDIWGSGRAFKGNTRVTTDFIY